MKLPAYPRYKHSGVAWLGDVPEHWEVKRLSYLATLKSGENITSEMIAEDGDYPVYGGNGLRGNYHKFTHRGHHALIGRQGALCGNINYASGEFWASEHALVVSPLKEFAVGWMGELLRAMNLGQYSATAAQPGVAAEIIRGLRIPVPPLPEQRTIAAFLDREMGLVDRLVAKKRELIERLKEKRTALISRTVTRGLPPAVARAAGFPAKPPLKPSGVEWLGDIPKHWQLVPLGYLVRLSGGATPGKSNAAFWDGSIPWVSPKDMKVARIADAEDHVSPEALANSALRLMPIGSVLIVVRGMILAHSFPVALTTAPVTINQDMKAVECRERVTPHFLAWLFAGFAKTFVSFADESAHGTRKLETGTLTRFPILLPPLPEQATIGAYLDEETAKLDALVGKVEEAVERLQEYRTALITAAVTGKIDVRGATSLGSKGRRHEN